MKFHDIEDKLIDYLDDALTAEQRLEVEEQLANSSELRQTFDELKMIMHGMDHAPEIQPSENLQNNFDAFLQNIQAEEKNNLGGSDATIVNLKNQNPNRNRFFLQLAAAAAILLFGIFVGKKMGGVDHVTIKEFADLETKMLNLLEKENSTSGRISAVNISYEIENPNTEIIDALIQSMNIDKSSNVRLAAMDALFHFADEPKVRTALCQTLNVQSNPMIQLSLIKMLVRLKEKQAVEHFENLLKKPETNQEVKDEAQMGIFKMM